MNRIVIIEDDPAILRGLADNLRLDSYDVLTAADGADGYRLVLEERPDLVILDLMLPGMSGQEVCRKIRQKLTTPVLMLTADDRESNRIQGFEAGADGFVSKPFSIRELLGRVRAILRRSNQTEVVEGRRVQERLMPRTIPQICSLRIAATCRPAGVLGGDYFDVVKLGESAAAVCIADVSGKGLPAAIVMSNLQATVRAYTSESTSPRELCSRLNRAMCASTLEHAFVTFFYAVIDADQQHLTYCNAGHNPAIVFRSDGKTEMLAYGGGILGVIDDWNYDEHQTSFGPGDLLVMYTDGVTETRNAQGEEFGEQRLIDLTTKLHDAEPDALTNAILFELSDFNNGKFEDDVTLLVVSSPLN